MALGFLCFYIFLQFSHIFGVIIHSVSDQKQLGPGGSVESCKLYYEACCSAAEQSDGRPWEEWCCSNTTLIGFGGEDYCRRCGGARPRTRSPSPRPKGCSNGVEGPFGGYDSVTCEDGQQYICSLTQCPICVEGGECTGVRPASATVSLIERPNYFPCELTFTPGCSLAKCAACQEEGDRSPSACRQLNYCSYNSSGQTCSVAVESSAAPSVGTTSSPTHHPTETIAPTERPTTERPTHGPTQVPTKTTSVPTVEPHAAIDPTKGPSAGTTNSPTQSFLRTKLPTNGPTKPPHDITIVPTAKPHLATKSPSSPTSNSPNALPISKKTLAPGSSPEVTNLKGGKPTISPTASTENSSSDSHGIVIGCSVAGIFFVGAAGAALYHHKQKLQRANSDVYTSLENE